jgi:hypothetical protein
MLQPILPKKVIMLQISLTNTLILFGSTQMYYLAFHYLVIFQLLQML